MGRLVMKFGGTSVANIDRIRNVARHVKREVDAGHDVAVVVSAMAGKTNELVAWTDGSGPAAQGLPLSDGRYAGGEFGWFSPFAVLCGVGLCVGYALLGACWLVRKCDEKANRCGSTPFVDINAFLLPIWSNFPQPTLAFRFASA